MDHKGIEYQVVQTASPYGWKWTVTLDANHTLSGESSLRRIAIVRAQHVIDKAVKDRLRQAR